MDAVQRKSNKGRNFLWSNISWSYLKEEVIEDLENMKKFLKEVEEFINVQLIAEKNTE